MKLFYIIFLSIFIANFNCIAMETDDDIEDGLSKVISAYWKNPPQKDQSQEGWSIWKTVGDIMRFGGQAVKESSEKDGSSMSGMKQDIGNFMRYYGAHFKGGETPTLEREICGFWSVFSQQRGVKLSKDQLCMSTACALLKAESGSLSKGVVVSTYFNVRKSWDGVKKERNEYITDNEANEYFLQGLTRHIFCNTNKLNKIIKLDSLLLTKDEKDIVAEVLLDIGKGYKKELSTTMENMKDYVGIEFQFFKTYKEKKENEGIVFNLIEKI